MAFVIQPLSSRHDRSVFDCGEQALNQYLQRYARQNEATGISRTFVAVPDGAMRVAGFYSLEAGAVAFENVPQQLNRRLPRYPVPVAHLGRLATCHSVRDRGPGGVLLVDALKRVLRIADEIGIAAVEVWAKTECTRDFCGKYGFQALRDDPLHLYLPLGTVRQVVSP